jgi:uracil-DNA glycosylase
MSGVRHVTSRRVSRVFIGRSPLKFTVHYHPLSDAFSMATPSENRVVYLEDLESPSSQATVASKDEKPSIVASSDPDRDESAKPKPSPSASNTNGKRQRTLLDMFGSAPSQGSDTPSKKPKFTVSSSGNDKLSSAGTQSSGRSSDPQSLNSIPFSLSEYIASLTGDQQKLLKLECETMGKSW